MNAVTASGYNASYYQNITSGHQVQSGKESDPSSGLDIRQAVKEGKGGPLELWMDLEQLRKPARLSGEEQKRLRDMKAMLAQGGPLSPEDQLQKQLAQGHKQDTRAFIYQGSELVAVMHRDGGTTHRNGFQIEGGNQEEQLARIQQRYGNSVRITEFAPGEGPTHAEAWEMFNQGRNYEQTMYQGYLQRQHDLFQHKQQQAQFQQQQQAWREEPQLQLMSMNGVNVAGWDKDGKSSINVRNLMLLSEQSGLDKETTQQIYRDIYLSESPEDVRNILEQHYSGQTYYEQVSADQAISRQQLMHSDLEKLADLPPA